MPRSGIETCGTEYLATVNVVYALHPRHSLRFGYRFWSNDRKNFVLSPDDPNETTTIKNTINLAWNGRLSRDARSRIAFEYELTDNPFVSVGGLCEAAIGDTAMPIGGNQPNDWVYYFQRQRIGTGANQPSDAIRLRANVSYSFDSQVSVTGFLNWNQEKNDKLNLYEYEGSMVNPGGQLMWVPDPRVAVVGGGSYNKIKSNAKICATVMDG